MPTKEFLKLKMISDREEERAEAASLPLGSSSIAAGKREKERQYQEYMALKVKFFTTNRDKRAIIKKHKSQASIKLGGSFRTPYMAKSVSRQQTN
jgi:UDP-N-acetylglucosamine:LPS N-acetylglucosamine transferase